MTPEAVSSRYFTFADDKSNKFWQISLDGTSYTVVYGRIGTSGQTQLKTFETDEQCSKEADKIIREKIAKGYVEEIDGITVASSAAVKPKASSGNSDDTKLAEEQVLQQYATLIDNKKPSALLPFLKAVDRRHYPALRKQIKAARKHFCEFVELQPQERKGGSSQQWGKRATEEQEEIIQLSGLALLPAADLKSFFFMHYFRNDGTNTTADGVLDWARPAWFTDYLNEDSRKQIWAVVDYDVLRDWEAKGYVHFQPELFARSISHFRPFGVKDGVAKGRRHCEFLCTDELAYTRDMPLLFEYETDLHSTVYASSNERNADPISVWGTVFPRLVAEGKIDLSWFISSCISVQTKDWNGNLRSFFRKQVDGLNLTATELTDHQGAILQLLGAQHPHVINWAVGLLKALAAAPGFDADALTEWAPAVMMRSDCKAAIKTLLAILERALKAKHGNSAAIISTVADVFALPDLALQTKAASLLKKYGEPEDEALRAKLSMYGDQLIGTLYTELIPFFDTTSRTAGPSAKSDVIYQYRAGTLPQLSELAEVVLPQTWNEWLFAIGGYISSDDPLNAEIVMNACILMPIDAPANGDQLLPYLNQMANRSGESRIQHYTDNWLLHITQQPQGSFAYTNSWGDHYQTLLLQVKRLQQVQKKMRADSKLPLLSFPTHAPYFIAPVTQSYFLYRI